MTDELSPREKLNASKIRSSLHECCLFLRKNDAFPLHKPTKIALFGNGARHTIKGGTGSSDVNAHYMVSVEQGLENAGFKIATKRWLDSYDQVLVESRKQFVNDVKESAKAKNVSVYMEAFGYVKLEPEYNIPLVGDAGVAIYVLSRNSGEGNDRRIEKGDFYLTDTEIRDINLLQKQYSKFMLVLNVGGVIDLSPLNEVENILLLSQLGSETGNVFADILLGKVNPCGKLTDTWARFEDYSPDIDFGGINNTYYFEDIFVGYKYFDSYKITPLYAFGFGLSYSEFKIERPKLTLDGHVACVKCDVTNISKIAGKETVQIYVSEPQGKLRKVYQKLAAFKKTSLLKAGGKESLSISFDLFDLASYDTQSESYILDKGQYVVRVGNASNHTRVLCSIVLDNMVIVKKVKNMYKNQLISSNIHLESPSCSKFVKYVDNTKTEEIDYKDIEYDYSLNSLTDDELINLALGSQRGDGLSSFIGESSMKVKGAAGETYSGIFGYKTLVMSDGPAGLRLSTHIGQYKGKSRDLSANQFMIQLYDFFPTMSQPFLKKFITPKKLRKNEELKLQYCTTLPSGTALAQSWNLEYAALCGDVAGSEMEEFGIDFWLAPGMNIHRSVRCGRNFEYYSEDPLLSGLIASSITAGVQSHQGKYVTLKHFACNNQEYNRFFSNSVVSERALREIYLKPFEIAIKHSHPQGVMSSYNLINGKHTSETKELIYDYLRNECGFDGIVMTDWILASSEPMEHSIYPGASPANVVMAYGQLFMPGSDRDYNELNSHLQNGLIKRSDLMKSLTPLVKFIQKK